MSVQRYETADGDEMARALARAQRPDAIRTFTGKRDANAFDFDVKARPSHAALSRRLAERTSDPFGATLRAYKTTRIQRHGDAPACFLPDVFRPDTVPICGHHIYLNPKSGLPAGIGVLDRHRTHDSRGRLRFGQSRCFVGSALRPRRGRFSAHRLDHGTSARTTDVQTQAL